MDILIQQHVGFLIVLALLVWFTELLVGHIKGNAWGWAIAYGLVVLLLILAALVALGLHL